MIPRLLAVFLRGMTLVVRFALSLAVARALGLDQTGLFFIYLAGVQMASGLLPFDLYATTARAVLRSHDRPPEGIGSELERHFGALMLIAVAVGPVAALIFYTSSPSVGVLLTIVFLVHVGLEAISNDIGRLLIPLSRPLLAAAFLFVRSAIWIVPAVILLETGVWATDALGLVLAWFGASVITTIMGLVLVWRGSNMKFRLVIDLQWLYGALGQSLIFFVGSLAFRFVNGGDRFLVERSLGLDAVAVYGFYVSLAFGVLALIETGNSAWNYPRLVKAIQMKEHAAVKSILSSYVWQNTFASVALCAALALSFPMVAKGLLDPIYFENTEMFLYVCLGILFICIALPFKYTIYGFGSDHVRLLGMIVGMIVLVIAWKSLLPASGLTGAGAMLAWSLGAIAASHVIGASLLMTKMKSWKVSDNL